MMSTFLRDSVKGLIRNDETLEGELTFKDRSKEWRIKIKGKIHTFFFSILETFGKYSLNNCAKTSQIWFDVHDYDTGLALVQLLFQYGF